MDKEKTCCGCCKKSSNKISPDYQSELSDVVVNQYERINGWSCPWHPLQATAWLFMIIFAISHFAILVDYLPKEWKAAGYIVPAGLLVVHVVYHLLCLSIDPSDIAVKARRSKKDTKNKATFDRNSRAHVIENLHCCICLTEVGGKSKHCSVCNKCVSDFDHHCKWLNNCVGGQNYKLFLGCIISAFVSGLAILVIDLYQFIFYFIDRQKLKTNSGRNDWKLFLPVPKEGYLAFISIIGILILVSLCLLGHLIIFHFYLICKGMTTYEYIVHLREKQLRGNKTDIESGEISPPKMQPIKGSPKKNGKRNLIENSKEFQSTTGDEESSEHEHFEREVVDGKNQQPPSDEEDDDVITTVPKPEAIKMTTVQITPARERRTKRRENGNEETPVAVSDRTKSKSRSISKQQSDNQSVESLQEVSISTQTANNNHHNASLNNSRNLQKKISEAAERTSNESDNLHTNLVRNSESEKEIDVKENLKKKKKRKKKVKKVTKKELPPVLTKARRPLPQLPALCEENELES